MIDFVALPLVGVLATALAASVLLARLRPRLAVWAHAILLVSVLIAAVPTLWLVGLSGVMHTAPQNPIADWSHHVLPGHRPAGAVVGLACLAFAILGSVRVGRVLVVHRQIRNSVSSPIEFIETDDVFAYTFPGPAGTVVVSRGLRRVLDDREFAVVVEHERAHARFRHDRFKILGMLTAAFVPPARSITRRLDHQLERWADEEALVRTGGDRRLAARTIAKVALANPSPMGTLGIGAHGAAARAETLLEPSPDPAIPVRVGMITLLWGSTALAMYQLHHNALFVAPLLP